MSNVITAAATSAAAGVPGQGPSFSTTPSAELARAGLRSTSAPAASHASATTCLQRPQTARCASTSPRSVPRASLLGKSAQALCVGMNFVLVHSAGSCVACSLNASVCEFCRSFFRFTSMSRGSRPVPLAPLACSIRARCKFFKTCFLILPPRAAACGSQWLHARRARARSATTFVRPDNKPPAESAPLRRALSASSMACCNCESYGAASWRGGSGAGASNSSIGSSAAACGDNDRHGAGRAWFAASPSATPGRDRKAAGSAARLRAEFKP